MDIMSRIKANNKINTLTKGGSKMKKILMVAVAVMMLAGTVFAGVVEDFWADKTIANADRALAAEIPVDDRLNILGAAMRVAYYAKNTEKTDEYIKEWETLTGKTSEMRLTVLRDSRKFAEALAICEKIESEGDIAKVDFEYFLLGQTMKRKDLIEKGANGIVLRAPLNSKLSIEHDGEIVKRVFPFVTLTPAQIISARKGKKGFAFIAELLIPVIVQDKVMSDDDKVMLYAEIDRYLDEMNPEEAVIKSNVRTRIKAIKDMQNLLK